LNRPDYLDEVVVFLGASYFRSLGRGQVYGISARGLGVNTAESGGEEFPAFRKFWVEQPAPGAKELVIHALLDSPSVSGAYRFAIHPGTNTQIEVHATLFPRQAISRLGIAPLTSMYFFGENDRGPPEDFRTEVHDSDGLLIWNGTGERLWRPVSNPDRLQVSSFQGTHLKGFGLLQRDQAFTSYEDLEARYDKRPSVWVEPLSGFEEGSVTLVEIPSKEEIHDNVVAFWVPQAPVTQGQELHFAYRLHWGSQPVPLTRISEVQATRVTVAGQPGVRRFVLDFSHLAKPPTAGTVEPVITVSSGRILRTSTQPHPVSGGWRVFFDYESAGDDPVEMRCFLKQGQEALSETWSYLWKP
jgi:glucans biosynthesis protein